MNSDFSFKKFQWKKIIAFALCMLMLVPQTAVFAADNAAKMEVVTDAKGSASGNADYSIMGSVNKYSYVYSGKNIKPAVTIRYASNKDNIYNKTASKNDYVLKYGQFTSKGKFKEKAIKEVGYYYVQVAFKDSSIFKGIPTQYYQVKVVPQKVKITNKKVNGKNATISWKKLTKSSVSKYEVTYTSDSYFLYAPVCSYDYNTKTVKNTSSSVKFHKTGTGKKNYVRVQAYKNVTYYDRYGYKYSERLYGEASNAKTLVFNK